MNLYLRPTALGAHAVHYFSNVQGNVGLWDEASNNGRGGYVYLIHNGVFQLFDNALQLSHSRGTACDATHRHEFVDEEGPTGDHTKVCQWRGGNSYAWKYLN